jgi:hypothetical protein
MNKNFIIIAGVVVLLLLAVFSAFRKSGGSAVKPQKGDVLELGSTTSSPPHHETLVEAITFTGLRPIPVEFDYDMAGGEPSGINSAKPEDLATLLNKFSQMPDSPVKDDLIRSALARWAFLDGRGAAEWASQRPELHRFIPDVLTAWATTSENDAAEAWKFARDAHDSGTAGGNWLASPFVREAFEGMAGLPEGIAWNELENLSGETAAVAMMGMAAFASDGQSDTAFTADMEERVHRLNSAPMAAAFYAAGGHISAAKEEIAGVAKADGSSTIAREIARQEAAFEPDKAVQWLASRFPEPSAAIDDIVEAIGIVDEVNGRAVLNWLATFPASNNAVAAQNRVFEAFPALRPGTGVVVLQP